MSFVCVICIESLVTSGTPPNADANANANAPAAAAATATDEGIITTKCGHMYHSKCLHEWVNRTWPRSNCPTCSKRIQSRKHLMRVYLPQSDDTSLQDQLALANLKVSDLEDSLLVSEIEANKINRELVEVTKERNHFREESAKHELKAKLWKNEFETVLCYHRSAKCLNPGDNTSWEQYENDKPNDSPECVVIDEDGQPKAPQVVKPSLFENNPNESFFFPVRLIPGIGFCIETQDLKTSSKTFVNFLISEDIGLQNPTGVSTTCPVKVEKFHAGNYENTPASLVEMIISPATFACTAVTPLLIQQFFIRHVYNMLKDKGGLDVDCLHIKIFKDTKVSVTQDPLHYQTVLNNTYPKNLLGKGTVVRRPPTGGKGGNVGGGGGIPNKRAKISKVINSGGKSPEIVTLD